jgi:undecaprenyl diphosphate synthase
MNNLPRHVAVIMDGNGRWARARGLKRIEGHRVGAESADVITTCCVEFGIPYLTLYAFSTENWKRPRAEVHFLMRYLRKFLREQQPKMIENGVRLAAIGDTDALPAGVRKELAATMEATRDCQAMTLTLALNYGARQEIVRAARALAAEARDGALDPAAIDETAFAARLDTAGTPDPDLLIRTAAEQRLSNFLLWQISYAELYVTDTLWPDFRRKSLEAALEEYAGRERRFGGISRGKHKLRGPLDGIPDDVSSIEEADWGPPVGREEW